MSQAIGNHDDGKQDPGEKNHSACGTRPPAFSGDAEGPDQQGKNAQRRKQRKPDRGGGTQALSGKRHQDQERRTGAGGHGKRPENVNHGVSKVAGPGEEIGIRCPWIAMVVWPDLLID
jgi:hypothetical protein